MSDKRTLILTEAEVSSLLEMPAVLKAVERGFRLHAKGRVEMPPKVYLHLDKYRGDLRAMPCYIGGMEACGIKWVNVHARNKSRGLPTVMALFILSDPATGFPLCIMGATGITSYRTGAAGGIAAKYMARKDSSVLALIGSGVQARTQLAAIKEFFNIKIVRVWGSDKAGVRRFAKDVASKGIKIEVLDTVRECVKGADIVVTTTPVTKPIVMSQWIGSGTHINAIGADAKGKEELEAKLIARARIIVDAREQAYHSGEINVPLSKGVISEKDVYATLGEVVAGKKKGRKGPEEVTVFDSTGLALQDVTVARLVYEKAVKKGIGKRFRLIP